MTGENLRPCPWCGGTEFMMAEHPFVMFCAGDCPVLDCHGETYKEMAERWNHRSLPAALDVVIEAVEKMTVFDKTLNAAAIGFERAWWAADNCSQRDALLAMLRALRTSAETGE